MIQFIKKFFTSKQIKKTNKALQDYLAFFTKPEGADLIKYIYEEDNGAYEDLVKNCPEYYICRNENQLITESKEEFTDALKNITNIYEIGAGSEYSIINKTLPILDYASDATSYTVIDFTKQYLRQARDFIQQKRPDLKIHTICADLMNGKIATLKTSQKKAILFLGGTMGNFTVKQQNHIMQQIKKMTSKGDIFIFTVDSNEDGKAVLKAYNNEYNYRFNNQVLSYFIKLDSEFKQHLAKFKIKLEWNTIEKSVELFFIAQNKVTFYFPKFGQITIMKDQKLKAGHSKRSNIAEVFDLVTQNDFKILKTLNNHSTINTFICERKAL